MKVKVETSKLRLGMFVSELDRPWVGTPFTYQGFEIRTLEELHRLRATAEYVYVLVGEHHDVALHSPPVPDHPYPGDGKHGRELSVLEPEAPAEAGGSRAAREPRPKLVPIEEEIERATEVEREAREVLLAMIDDAHLGRRLDVPRVKRVISQMTDSILHNPDAMIWLTQLRKKHEYTATHSLRVCAVALAFGNHLGYDRERLNMLGIGALLHDIGKFRIPNELLDKPDALNPKEFEILKSHVPEGLKLLHNSSGIPQLALEVVGRHHERLNGRGYMSGLYGDSIGEFGMVSAIVDTYDAITSDRSYRSALSPTEALRLIYQDRQHAYNARLVEEFIRCMGIFPIGSIVEMTTGEVGVVVGSNPERRLRPRVELVLAADHKPLSPSRVVDLKTIPHDAEGRVIEIRHVLPAGAWGINPAEYIPVPR